MAFKVVITPPQRLSVNISPKVADNIEKTLRDVTVPLFVQFAEAEAQRLYYTDRPGARRRGHIRYSTGFKATVKPGSGRTTFGSLASMQCTNASQHARALEFGTGGSRTFRYSGKPLKIPGTPGTPGVTAADAYGSAQFTRPMVAFSAPIKGSRISERMAKRAMRQSFPR